MTVQKVCDLMPYGKEAVAECIKQLGNYLVENAEVMANDISRVEKIEIIGKICVDEFPSIEVNRKIRIPNANMIIDKMEQATTEG